MNQFFKSVLDYFLILASIFIYEIFFKYSLSVGLLEIGILEGPLRSNFIANYISIFFVSGIVTLYLLYRILKGRSFENNALLIIWTLIVSLIIIRVP